MPQKKTSQIFQYDTYREVKQVNIQLVTCDDNNYDTSATSFFLLLLAHSSTVL